MTDDQGYGDLGCHGNEKIKTPNLDRLASQGVELTQFFVCPVCAPTRASLMTGRYRYRCGVWSVANGGEAMHPDEVTIAEILAGAGYRTGIFGKWHLGEYYPLAAHGQGFHEFFGFRTGHWENYFDTTLERNSKPVQTKGYITDVLTDEALKFIEANRDEPFFCYVPYNAPHSPFQVPQRYLKPYQKMGLPDRTARVYAMVTNIDDNVGRLLAKLDELKVAKDTIVIFLTDNGPNGRRFNCGLRRAKGSAYEGGIRVPFFIRWPGHLPAGRKVDTIAAHIDVMPTLLELCGLAPPKDRKIDGLSLLPLIAGDAKDWPDRKLFFQWQRSMRPQRYRNCAVRTQRYKLMNGKELYDIPNDPGEKKNIAAQHPDLVKKLREAYDKWWDEVTTERGLRRPPIPVGHPEENPSVIMAHHVNFHGKVRFNGAGWAHSWITRWTAVSDFIHWDLDIANGGRYEVSLTYRCSRADAGSRIRLTIGEATLEFELPAAERMKANWLTRPFGTLTLKPGKAKLTIKALAKPGKSVMELINVKLRRLS